MACKVCADLWAPSSFDGSVSDRVQQKRLMRKARKSPENLKSEKEKVEGAKRRVSHRAACFSLHRHSRAGCAKQQSSLAGDVGSQKCVSHAFKLIPALRASREGVLQTVTCDVACGGALMRRSRSARFQQIVPLPVGAMRSRDAPGGWRVHTLQPARPSLRGQRPITAWAPHLKHEDGSKIERAPP